MSDGDLPIIQTIGKFIALPIFRAIFHGIEFLMDHALVAVENCRWREDNGRAIFAHCPQGGREGNTALTDLDVQLDAYNLTVAGLDNTAVTLTYLVWTVMSHPELQIKLEKAVDGLLDDFGDADVEELPLNVCINENLRLYGAVPGSLPRVILKGGATLGGYHIPRELKPAPRHGLFAVIRYCFRTPRGMV